MISCKLQGGLGNQMFQIATTYALALRNNDSCVFDFEKCHTPLQGYKSTKYQSTIFKNISTSKNFIPSKVYFEPKFSFTEIIYQPNILLTGYFQSEKYFDDVKNEITNLFFFEEKTTELILDYIQSINPNKLPTTAVHIRRGDYLLNPDFHHPLSKDYFNQAIDIIGNSCYIFVSDDINWVKTNFVGKNIFYFEDGDEILDLTLMTLTDNIIISNSSFSWWGAYLNKNKDKKVIAPKIWFGKNGFKDIMDIIPDNWKKI